MIELRPILLPQAIVLSGVMMGKAFSARLTLQPTRRTNGATTGSVDESLIESMTRVCAILGENTGNRFDLSVCGDSWAVDIAFDFLTILPLLPRAIGRLLDDRYELPVRLSFYEQGIQRDVVFSRLDDETLTVNYTACPGGPVISNGAICKRMNVICDLCQLLQDFLSALRHMNLVLAEQMILNRWLAQCFGVDDEESDSWMFD